MKDKWTLVAAMLGPSGKDDYLQVTLTGRWIDWVILWRDLTIWLFFTRTRAFSRKTMARRNLTDPAWARFACWDRRDHEQG